MIQKKNMFWSGFFFLIGIGLIVAAFICSKNTREFINKAKNTDGVVIATPYGGSSHQVIEYTNASGEKDQFSEGGRIPYKVGDRVRVLYDPADPTNPRIDDFGVLYSSTRYSGIIGIGCIVMAILALFGLVK